MDKINLDPKLKKAKAHQNRYFGLPSQPHLPRLLHGNTNMESGIISCYEYRWTIPRIAKLFKVKHKTVKAILINYGYHRHHPPESGHHSLPSPKTLVLPTKIPFTNQGTRAILTPGQRGEESRG